MFGEIKLLGKANINMEQNPRPYGLRGFFALGRGCDLRPPKAWYHRSKRTFLLLARYPEAERSKKRDVSHLSLNHNSHSERQIEEKNRAHNLLISN